MRRLFGLMCLCALGFASLIGCGESGGDGATGGSGGDTFPCTERGIRDAIALGGGPHTFECDGPTVVVTRAEIAIDNDVILDGEGRLIAFGNFDHRVFMVSAGVTAELRGFVVTGGLAPGGGGLLNAGVLMLTNSVVSGNDAAEGGGILNVKAGTMTMTSAAVFSNTASLGGGIFNDGTLTAMDTAVFGNTAEASGGGIFNEREATLTATNVSGNMAGGDGGGIACVPGGEGNDGPGKLTLTNSTVSENEASLNGGGISSHGTVALARSTVSGNRGQSGGGVYNRGTFTVTSGTVSGNISDSCGGGIDNDGTLTLTNITVSGNTASDCGGGIFNQASLTVTSSTLSANSAVRGDALGNEDQAVFANTVIDGDCDNREPLISGGYNIESTGDTCDLDEATGDQVGVTAEQLDLGPLQHNGGPTQTHSITTDSAAFNVIPEPRCRVEEDERGVTRPQGRNCDIGAFELEI